MIEAILKSSLKFEGKDNSDKFITLFKNLYQIELFKDPFDLILTMVKSNQLKFEIKIIKGWDTNVGCYLTEQNKIYNKFLKTFTKKLDHKIIIRNLTTNVMAHEMAHALEVESGLTLNEDFRTAIGLDIKNREAENITLRSSIKRIMIDGIKPYPQNQILSELFARYFELLSISRDTSPDSAFTANDTTNFFINTSKYIKEIFCQKIKPKIDQEISEYTINLTAKAGYQTEKKFTYKVDSFHQKSDIAGGKSWSANLKSNSSWQESWNKYQKQIEDKNN